MEKEWIHWWSVKVKKKFEIRPVQNYIFLSQDKHQQPTYRHEHFGTKQLPFVQFNKVYSYYAAIFHSYACIAEAIHKLLLFL